MGREKHQKQVPHVIEMCQGNGVETWLLIANVEASRAPPEDNALAFFLATDSGD
jgi:hypothetical protein